MTRVITVDLKGKLDINMENYEMKSGGENGFRFKR
jgi:hypothetical protein